MFHLDLTGITVGYILIILSITYLLSLMTICAKNDRLSKWTILFGLTITVTDIMYVFTVVQRYSLTGVL